MASLVRVTVAPGTTDPERSVTTPVTRDVVPCANPTVETISRIARVDARERMQTSWRSKADDEEQLDR